MGEKTQVKNHKGEKIGKDGRSIRHHMTNMWFLDVTFNCCVIFLLFLIV